MSSNRRYYLNPETGRVIKSDGKTYLELHENDYIVPKHKCFYNIKSAKKCLNKLFELYPSLVHPPSSFATISPTYSHGPAVAFVTKLNETNVPVVHAFVDKHGDLHKLNNPVYTEQTLVTVKDPLSKLPIESAPLVHASVQTAIEEQLQTTPIADVALVYNPIQNDFIPVDNSLTKTDQHNVLDVTNTYLVPEKLDGVVEDSNIAAIVTKNSKAVGTVSIDNKIQMFAPESIDVVDMPSLPSLELKYDLNKEQDIMQLLKYH